MIELHLQNLLIHPGHLLDRLYSSWQGLQLDEEVLGLPDTNGFLLESKHTHPYMQHIISSVHRSGA